jgi:hypothetical protein
LTHLGVERHADAARLLDAEERAVVDAFNAQERQDLGSLLERLAATK